MASRAISESGDPIIPATIRLTIGSATRSAGNAIVHDPSHAAIHLARKPWSRPKLIAVETPDTMQDIMTESSNVLTTPA